MKFSPCLACILAACFGGSVLRTALPAWSGEMLDLKDNLLLPGGGESTETEPAPPAGVIPFGEAEEGNAVCFVVEAGRDIAASGDLKHVQEDLVRLIRDLSPSTRFELIFFNAGIQRFPAAGRQAAAAGDREAAIAWVRSRTAGCGSSPADGLQEALRSVRAAPAARHALVYCGASSRDPGRDLVDAASLRPAPGFSEALCISGRRDPGMLLSSSSGESRP